MSPQSGLRVQRSAWECCTLKNNTRVVLFDSCSLAGVATLCHDRSVIVSLLCSVAACARVIILSVNTWIVHTSVIHTLLLTLALLTQFLCVGFSLTIFSHSSANNPLVSLTSDRPLTLSTFQLCVLSVFLTVLLLSCVFTRRYGQMTDTLDRALHHHHYQNRCPFLPRSTGAVLWGLWWNDVLLRCFTVVSL